MQKCYSYNLHGFVFNDTDGTVKVVCCCENGIMEDFLAEVRSKSRKCGSEIKDVVKEEIPFRKIASGSVNFS